MTLWVSPGLFGWECQLDRTSGDSTANVWRGSGYPSRVEAVEAVYHVARGYLAGCPGVPGVRQTETLQNDGVAQKHAKEG